MMQQRECGSWLAARAAAYFSSGRRATRSADDTQLFGSPSRRHDHVVKLKHTHTWYVTTFNDDPATTLCWHTANWGAGRCGIYTVFIMLLLRWYTVSGNARGLPTVYTLYV